MFVHLCLSQIISCCILRSEDDPVSLTERQYSPALHALPTEPSPFFHLLLFLRQPGSISRGNRLGIWGLWVSIYLACFLPLPPKLPVGHWLYNNGEHFCFQSLSYYLWLTGWGIEDWNAQSTPTSGSLTADLPEPVGRDSPLGQGQSRREWLLLFKQHLYLPFACTVEMLLMDYLHGTRETGSLVLSLLSRVDMELLFIFKDLDFSKRQFTVSGFYDRILGVLFPCLNFLSLSVTSSTSDTMNITCPFKVCWGDIIGLFSYLLQFFPTWNWVFLAWIELAIWLLFWFIFWYS